MPSFDETLAALGGLVRLEARTERDRRANLEDATQSKAFRDERDADLLRQIESVRREKRQKLGELVRYPPFHDRHFAKLHQFHDGASSDFDKSVFIMTKFPEGTSAMDVQLQHVIDAVKRAIADCGHVPRIASDMVFHPLLWDNVELYLLGCRRGIAILEDKYKPELNPNVAMEWGWMRGMGRDILPLVENEFNYRRADWGGLIEHRFDWLAPDVKSAVSAWLTGSAARTGGNGGGSTT